MKRALLSALLLFALVGFEVLAPSRQLFHRDTARHDYPVWHEIAQRYSKAQLPLWDPWSESGTSTLGQLTPGALHPFALLHFVLPFDLAFKLQHLLALPLALLGTFLLARKIGAARNRAIAAGFAYGGCGFLVSMAGSNLPYVLGGATLPWALWTFARHLEAPSWKRLLLAAAVLSLFGFAGEPLSMLVACVLGGLAALWLRKPMHAILWVALGAALSAPQMLPAALRIPSSTRAHGLAAKELGRYELKPLRLAGLFVPRAFDDRQETVSRSSENTAYEEFLSGSAGESAPFADCILIGPAALLLALGAARSRRGRVLLGGALVLLLAACGESLGVWRALGYVIPGLSIFRFPEKLVAPASLLLCLAASLGLVKRRESIIATILSAAVVLLLPSADSLAAIGKTHAPAAAIAFHDSLRLGLLVLTAACALLAVLPKCAPIFLAAGALFVPRPYTAPLALFKAGDALRMQLESLAGPSAGRWRIVTDERPMYGSAQDRRVGQLAGATAALMPRLNELQKVETAAAYSSVFDADYVRLHDENPPQFLRIFGVRFAILLPVDIPKSRLQAMRRGPHGLLIRELPEKPRAWFAGEQDFDGPKGQGEVLSIASPRPEILTIQARAQTESLLIVGDHFDPGWSAKLDGAPVEVKKVDAAALGVVVPAGDHQLELRFFPPGFLAGIALALSALAAVPMLGRWRPFSRS